MTNKLQKLQQFLRWFWQIAQGYFVSSQRWRAFALLLLVIIATIASRPIGLQANIYTSKITTALAEKDFTAYRAVLLISTGLTAALIFTLLLQSLIEQKFKLYWREWLTNQFLECYFSNRTFYQVNGDGMIDNPDQRISQDIDSFIDQSLRYFLGLGGTLLGGFLYINTLWNINNSLMLIAIATAILQTLVTYFIGRVLTPLNFRALEYEADFRYGLVHIRNNSEAIAFYQGEKEEKNQISDRFHRLLTVLHAKILPSSTLNAFQIALSIITTLICTLLLAPSYFNGEVNLGDFQLSIIAFRQVVSVFNWFSINFGGLTVFAAIIKRLGTLQDYFVSHQHPPIAESAIQTYIEPRLAWNHLTIITPDRQRTLVKNLSGEVEPSKGLLVMGGSGFGKSSLLRAVAGLWTQGEGYIYRPQTSKMLFIPQRPYMVLGSLRKQVSYPHQEGEFSDQQILQVLDLVNLGDLAERVGGLDKVLDWADVLSLGEQQRLGFARLFLHNPAYAVLDEATSALDVANEKQLYQWLRESGITYLSVGHRPTLIPFHSQVLEILGGGKWRTFPASPSSI